MLYSEFLEGTGCRDNEANKEAYKKAEALYMSSDDLTHEDVYKVALQLWIDNSLSEEQLKHNEEVKKEIELTKAALDQAKSDYSYYKNEAAMKKQDIQYYQNQLKQLKSCIYK